METVAQLGDLGGGQMGKYIHSAALEAEKNAVGILNDLIGDLGQVGLFAPVIIKPLQHHGLLSRPGNELERAGAHGDGILLRVVLGQHSGGQIRSKLIIGLLQLETDGVIPLLIHLHVGKSRHLDDVCRSIGIAAALVGPDHVLRRHFLTVVELHTGAELKGIQQMVLGNGIALRHSGIQVAAGVGLQKSFKYVEHDLTSSCLHGFVRVKTAVQVLGDAHVQLAGRSAGRGAFRLGVRGALVRSSGRPVLAAASASAEYGAQEADRRQKRQDSLLHMQFSFLYHCSGESVYSRSGFLRSANSQSLTGTENS